MKHLYLYWTNMQKKKRKKKKSVRGQMFFHSTVYSVLPVWPLDLYIVVYGNLVIYIIFLNSECP